MNDDEKYLAIEAMQQYGGGFVKALAFAWIKGDPQNRARLEAAFTDYFEQYRRMAAAQP